MCCMQDCRSHRVYRATGKGECPSTKHWGHMWHHCCSQPILSLPSVISQEVFASKGVAWWATTQRSIFQSETTIDPLFPPPSLALSLTLALSDFMQHPIGLWLLLTPSSIWVQDQAGIKGSVTHILLSEQKLRLSDPMSCEQTWDKMGVSVDSEHGVVELL